MLKFLKIACFVLAVSSVTAAPYTTGTSTSCEVITNNNSDAAAVEQPLSTGVIFKANSHYIDTAVMQPEVLLEALEKENSSQDFSLFSHGRPGELLINGKWLQKEEISAFVSSKISNLQSSISNLNIYGCNFAQGEKGLEAVKFLEKELGLSIAASTNITGKDGDWKLEAGNATSSLQLRDYKYSLQIGKTHYLPPHVGSTYTNGAFWSYEEVVLSTNETTAFNVTVTDGAGTPIAGSPFSLSKSTPQVLTFGAGSADHPPMSVPRAQLGGLMTGVGLILTGAEDFLVNYRSKSGSHAGSLTSKAESAPGRAFKWATAPQVQGVNAHTYMSILAVEDAVVTISGYDSQLEFTGGITANTINITLQAGESVIYEVQTTDIGSFWRDGMMGADITATGNIVVNTGHQAGYLTGVGQGDHGIDQLVPTSLVGNEYIIVQGNGGSNEAVWVTATANNTMLFLNDSATQFGATLQNGEYVRIPGNLFSSGVLYLTSSEPVYVHHTLYGGGGSNTQGLSFIPPISCAVTPDVEIAFVGNIESTNYSNTELNVIIEAGGVLDIQDNGISITLPAPQPILGTASYELYNITTINENNNYTVISASPKSVSLFGAAGNAGWSGYFSGFAPPSPEVDAGLAGTTVIIGNNFTADATVGSGTIAWTTSGTGTFADATIEDAVYSPSAADITAGSVTLTITVTGSSPLCPGNTSTDSIIITFVNNPCTDGAIVGTVTANDPDADGINNVCDLDDDNDGILDTVENSLGIFNSEDATTAVPNGITLVSTGGGSFLSGSVPTVLYTNNNDGPYTAEILKTINGLNTGGNYNLTVKGIGATAATNSATNTIKIEVGTAVLYDDLLANFVTTYGNFGDIILSGVALTANPVLKITFDRPINDANVDPRISSFNYAFNVDSDLDTIPDFLDLDSDGDECPDAAEAGYSGVALLSSGVNANDGIIDNTANAIIETSGMWDTDGNGYADALETAAGSGIINYTISEDLPGLYNFLNPALNNCFRDYMRHGKSFKNNKEQPMDFGGDGN